MRISPWCGLLLAGLGAPALAMEMEWFDGALAGTLNTRVSFGVAWRMQDRTSNLIGKLNLEGQQNTCASDNCISLTGDPRPNQRIVDAGGAYSGVNSDDGDLNYDKGDIVAATIKVTPDFTLHWGEFLGRVRAIGFFDPANVDFQEKHVDTRYQPARTERPASIERVFAAGINLMDAYVQYGFQFGERSGTISVGSQTVRWGESTLLALNSLNEINPPNAAILRMPGSEINEIFQPVPVVLLSSDIAEGLSAELLYQLKWKAVQPDPRGSFFSDSDLIGGDTATITLGIHGEDPNDLQRPAPVLGDLSSTSLTLHLSPPREPRDGGQYGLRVNYFADWFNGGTETAFYFLNYHSRLPYATVIATDDSCARDSATVVEAIIACNGFNGTLQPFPDTIGREPLPIDTLGAFLDYPEDIQMYGISFNTNLGDWSAAGEFAYRPNLPVQVHLSDLIFYGLTPAFPDNPVSGDPTPVTQQLIQIAASLGISVNDLTQSMPGLAGELAQLSIASFPSNEQAIPSSLAAYRHDDRVDPHQEIKGYERLKVGEWDLTFIRALSNTFGADQILFIGEVGGTWVFNMPPREQVQFEGGGPNRTHYSAGADGTGEPGGVPNPSHLSPHQQTEGFADEFSWGIRTITQLEYNDVLFNWTFKPTLIAGWDVNGIAPFPMQNFVEGRKEITAGTQVNFTQLLSGRVFYQWFTGGGRENTRSDRDNLAISLSYAF
ncbi:MAG TPA: DUF1302 family protein [Solimonas sp.]|nr:DUF1302 family protein [Solimonas sp.]